MFLLDTNVVSKLRTTRVGKADRNVTAWVQTVPAGSLFLSMTVIQELEIGVLLAERRDLKQGSRLHIWLDAHVLPALAGRILPVNTTVVRRNTSLHLPDSDANGICSNIAEPVAPVSWPAPRAGPAARPRACLCRPSTSLPVSAPSVVDGRACPDQIHRPWKRSGITFVWLWRSLKPADCPAVEHGGEAGEAGVDDDRTGLAVVAGPATSRAQTQVA
jgi:hypothetical protein